MKFKNYFLKGLNAFTLFSSCFQHRQHNQKDLLNLSQKTRNDLITPDPWGEQ